ncbi:Pleckstrin domain [Trinorchestia longiramus]|nr:Pleckstrin domain [Trinorchestia longiramus]
MENVMDISRKKKNTEKQIHETNTVRAGSPKPLLKPLLSNLKITKDDGKTRLKKCDDEEMKSQAKGLFTVDAELEGNLKVHSQTLLKQDKQKVYYFILFRASKSGRARLVQYVNKDSVANKFVHPELSLLSSDIIKIDDLSSTNHDDDDQHTFLIQSKEHNLVLSATNTEEKNRWISAVQEILLSDCDSPTRRASHHFSSTENISLPKTFQAHISKSTQVRIGDDSPVDLVVDVDHLSVIASNKVRLVKWPIVMLRKHGFTSSTFYVEAGRNTEAGEGKYEFLTSEGEDIHRTMRVARRSYSIEDRSKSISHCSSSPPSFTPQIYSDNIYEPIDPVASRDVQHNKFNTPPGPCPLTKLHASEENSSASALYEETYSTSNNPANRLPYNVTHRKSFGGVKSRPEPSMLSSAPSLGSSKDVSKSVTAFPIFPRKVPIVDTIIDDNNPTEVVVPPTQFQKNAAGLPKSPTRGQYSYSVHGSSKMKSNVPLNPYIEELRQSTFGHREIKKEQSLQEINNDTSEQNVGEIYALVDKSKKTKKPVKG